MLHRFFAKFLPIRRGAEGRDHFSILVPFLIISIGLGVLAWRSYELSVKMERSANTLAVQYAGYAADISARRLDNAVRSEFARVGDEWQHVERRTETPDTEALREWIGHNEWIVSAIYVPDHDPASSIFVSEIGDDPNSSSRFTREFFTSTGTVKYTVDPGRLLLHVRDSIRQQPLIRTTSPDMLDIQQRAEVSVVQNTKANGLVRMSDGFAFFAPLSSPLAGYTVRAAVRTAYAGTFWENQRVISMSASLAALALMTAGLILAFRGLKKESETMKLRGDLIANVSHELRTPLAMIRLGAETLKRGAKLKEKERVEIEDQILREVLHLSHLVENVLDIARMRNGAFKTMAVTLVDPRDLVVTLINSYESWIRSKGFSIATYIEDGIDAQMWDREAVSRALLNLIDNAIKYSEDQKAIEVVVSQTPDHVVLSVRDYGIGIDARDLERIFDPYYRARFSDTQTRRGAGLGLTLVRQIVESHGGRVEVDSQPGSGSTFRMLFPRPTAEERVAVAGLIQQSKPVTP
jgi:signal transduction histidine kinase